VYFNRIFLVENFKLYFAMNKQRTAKQLAKFLDYILSRRPDEFGLVADAHGYFKIKELLKAINEEEGLRYVRRSHLEEILITLPDHPFETADKLIRSKVRDRLPQRSVALDAPKLLFTCVRLKAYPHVSIKGIRPTGFSHIILSSDMEMAERIGRRFDQAPILLHVNVQQSEIQGVVFLRAGETLYLADFIPEGCFTGPALPKEKPVSKQTKKTEISQAPQTAGTFFIEMDENGRAVSPASSKGKDTKADRRKKKIKRKRQPPPWRR
jgi:putative RNA 2'-phosphotransferase